MSEISNLNPKAVWQFFDEICSIPHPSHKEARLSKHLQEFGKKLGLETLVDEYGNVLIRKPASAGYEKCESLLFQSHIDMVCEKNSDVDFDFDNDGIQPYIDGEWVKAKGTTLGADDGIGVAYQMAILADNSFKHGPIECLFTVDEEVGLLGAHVLKEDWIKSTMLVNLDSEDQGEFCIGCAGGVNTVAKYDQSLQSPAKDYLFMQIKVGGLIGGHSGVDIDKNRGNAIKILAELINRISAEGDVVIASIDGGNLHNAIPREASATIGVEYKIKETARVITNVFIAEKQSELSSDEKLDIELSTTDKAESVFAPAVSKSLIKGLLACPHGVLKMSEDIPGLVETSTNLASVKMIGNEIVIETSQRSSVSAEKENIRKMVYDAFASNGASSVESDEGYPGWKPNVNSKIKNIAVDTYEKLFNVTPNVGAIHAGLECGLIIEKYPELDMISIGPTIIGNHSPAEKVSIPTVEMTWRHVLAIIDTVCNS